MSSAARSYKTLSGWTLLSALVDLSTFFFLCRIWALDCVAPMTKIAIINRNAKRWLVAYGGVRSKQHLSKMVEIPSNVCRGRWGRAARNPELPDYNLNQRPGCIHLCPFGP